MGSASRKVPEIQDKLDLNVAADRVITNSNTDFIIDRLGINILEEFKDEFVDHLRDKINTCETRNVKYEPSPLITIDVPKKDFTIRPGAIPEIIDRIYYQALCDSIAHTIEGNLVPVEDKILFSYRLSSKSDDAYMFVKPNEAYRDFINHQNLICDGGEFPYVLETDVADYFERIYHHNLVNLLGGFGCDMDIVTCLSSLLRKWRNGISYGIPQSMWPSDLLGNAYLDYLDELIFKKYKYMRYVDDMRVFCKSESEAKRALKDICVTIRDLGLNIQPAKTYIHEKERFCSRIRFFSDKLTELVETKKEEIIVSNPYFDEFVVIEEFKDRSLDIELDKLFYDAIEDHKDEMTIKFCLSGYAYTRQTTAVQFCLENLAELPHLSSYFINYLTSLDFNKNIVENILIFLKSENNIYQWQEMCLLRYFFLLPELSEDIKSYLKDVLLNGNKHVACRSISALLLGKSNKYADLMFLQNNFDSIDNMWVKRAIIYAIKDLSLMSRNHTYNYWKRQNWRLDQAVRYAKHKANLETK